MPPAKMVRPVVGNVRAPPCVFERSRFISAFFYFNFSPGRPPARPAQRPANRAPLNFRLRPRPTV
jgi:hypothetical protein